MRRPPSSFEPDATLLEKHPELEHEWRLGGPHAHILRNYMEPRKYRTTDPIRWRKPEAFTRADKACCEFAGTLGALQSLASYASEDNFDEGEGDEPNYRREALLQKFVPVTEQLAIAQKLLAQLGAASEYRWLQGHVPGEFADIPINARKNYTRTTALVEDNRLHDLRSVLTDAEAIPHMEQSVRSQLDGLNILLDALERHMHQEGPVFGYSGRHGRMQAVQDHRTCLDTLIPHMRAQLELIEKELPAMGGYAVQVTTIRAKEDGPPPPVTHLDREFKSPSGQEAPEAKAVNNVTGIGKAFETRAHWRRMAEQGKPEPDGGRGGK